MSFLTTQASYSRTLDIICHLIRSCGEEGSIPQGFLEDHLPNLCFGLPSDAGCCAQLLRSLPLDSPVWKKLEEGLSERKYLSLEVTVTLYETQPSSIEAEMLRVLNDYADSKEINSYCNKDTKKKGFKHFSNVLSEMSQDLNFWKGSPLGAAAANSVSVFTVCLKLLIHAATSSNFSMTSVVACKDFLQGVLQNSSCDLYTFFPTHLQNLVYLLTIPEGLGKGHQCMNLLPLVEASFCEVLKHENVTTIQAILCFFPSWLSVLDESSYLHQYLNEQKCDCLVHELQN